MKILYVGSLEPTACATFYLHAMQKAGFEVTPFDPQLFATDGLFERVVQRVRKAPAPTKIEEAKKEIVQACKKRQYDAVFVMSENFLAEETLEEVRSLRNEKPLFLYHSHDNNFSDGILKPKRFFETLAKYDFVFTTKSQNVARYKELGQKNALYIPSAFDPAVHRPIAGKSQFDISFIGTYDYSRDKYLDQVGWEHLYVWGNGWKRFSKFNQYKGQIVDHAIYLKEYAEVVSHSKISLGLLRDEAQDLHTQRTFEIPACRSFQIAPRNAEILGFFEEDREIVCFSSLEELADKTQYYLKNEAQREKIAEAGYQKCLKSGQTYQDRIQSIIKTTGL